MMPVFSEISLITFTRQASRTAEKAIPMKTNVNQSGADIDDAKAGPEPLVIFGFDRVTLWLDRPELPIALGRLKRHCTKIKVDLQQMLYQARWKLRLEIFQPTAECLELLEKALGDDIAVQLTYVEIACDFPGNGKKQTRQWRNAFLGAAKMKYQRQSVVRDKTTWYFGRRTDGEKRSPQVLAVYADKPSKLNNARPSADLLPCVHIEWRATGNPVLASLGIISLGDLIQFDHRRFWNVHIRLYELPKPTALGRLLAKVYGTETNVSGSALRMRTARWIKNHTTEGKFVMHNALLTDPEIAKDLNKVPFLEWVKMMFR